MVEVDDFVARRQNGDPGRPVHQGLAVRDRGEHAELRGPQGGAGGEHRVALVEVFALVPHVAPRLRRRDDGHPVLAVGLGVLLAHDGISAGRQRSPREDPGRLAGPQRFGGEATRRDRLDDVQLGAGAAGDVRAAHRVAVHRGVVPGRQVHRAGDVFGQDQVERVAQGTALGRQRPQVLEDEPCRLRGGEHRQGGRIRARSQAMFASVTSQAVSLKRNTGNDPRNFALSVTMATHCSASGRSAFQIGSGPQARR